MAKNYAGLNFNSQSFQGQSLTGADFRNATLHDADFRDCDLRSANFSQADLRGARFDRARTGRSPAWEACVANAAFLVALMFSFVTIGSLAVLIGFALNGPVEDRIPFAAVATCAMVTLGAVARYGFRRPALTWSLAAGALAAAVVFAVARTFAGAFAIAVAFAFAVAGMGAVPVAIAGASAGVVAGALAGAAAVALAFVAAPASTAPTAFAVATVAIVLFQLHLAWRVRKKDGRIAVLIGVRNAVRAVVCTRFDGADLTGASFTSTRLTGVKLRGARLARVNWRDARGLDECIHADAVLAQRAVRELLTTGDGRSRSYARMDLHGANLAGADLSGANLRETNCTGANFRGAELTGACIESWNIDAATCLEGVQCRYVYLLEAPDALGTRKRRPADPERCFEPGEFELLYTKVLEEMEILLKKGLAPAAMREAFRELRENHPEVTLRKFEERGSHVLVSLDVPTGAAEADVERTLVSGWELRFRIADAEKRLLEAHNRDIREMALAAAAAGVSVQVGDNKVEDKSIRVDGGLTIRDSQVGSLTGDVSHVVQTLQESGGQGAAELAGVLEELLGSIHAAKELGEVQKLEARQQVELIAAAASAPKEQASQSAAGRGFERLSVLLDKAPGLAQLVESAAKAWEAVARTVGA